LCWSREVVLLSFSKRRGIVWLLWADGWNFLKKQKKKQKGETKLNFEQAMRSESTVSTLSGKTTCFPDLFSFLKESFSTPDVTARSSTRIPRKTALTFAPIATMPSARLSRRWLCSES